MTHFSYKTRRTLITVLACPTLYAVIVILLRQRLAKLTTVAWGALIAVLACPALHAVMVFACHTSQWLAKLAAVARGALIAVLACPANHASTIWSQSRAVRTSVARSAAVAVLPDPSFATLFPLIDNP